MLKKFFETNESYVLFVQRVLLALVIFPHGAQKLLGWFGGYGFSATLGFLQQSMGIPMPLGVLVIVAESLGAIALIAGLFSRLVALGHVLIMVGAIAMVHGRVGFFMNWFGKQAGEGYEYHLLVIALAVGIAIAGAGKFSLDAVIAKALGRSEPKPVPVAA